MLSRLSVILSSLPFAAASSRGPTPNTILRGMATAHSGATETATFASGCFWGTEHIFLKKYGPYASSDKEGGASSAILSTKVGFTGGRTDAKNPSYKDVCTGRTGHAEAVKIEFDPSKVSYDELVGMECIAL